MIEMTESTLICYGTRYGSTGEIAEQIAEIHRGKGISVSVVNLKNENVKNLTSYDLVIVGSGIQMNRWTKEPKKFLQRNKELLSRKRVAIFVSCGSANDPALCDEAREKYLQQIADEYPEINFVSMGLFGPKYDSTRGNFFMRKVMKGMLEDLAEDPENPPEVLDLRDWAKIERWAESLINNTL
jgi:menaquinone-dependent protoporphyrinogen oxidase